MDDECFNPFSPKNTTNLKAYSLPRTKPSHILPSSTLLVQCTVPSHKYSLAMRSPSSTHLNPDSKSSPVQAVQNK